MTENLWVSARLRALSKPAAAQSVPAALARFGLTDLATRRTATLSLGNRQRLGLACALIRPPRVLVLDEPSNALDPIGVMLLRDAISGLAGSGAAVLVSSHHFDEVARVAHMVSVMHGGELVGALDPGGLDLERQFFATVLHAVERAIR